MNRQHPRVLVVEDEPTICHVLAKMFELWHWESFKAETVAEAVGALNALIFDLVILDLMLPDGSGTEILRKIRYDGLTPTIAISTARDLAIVVEVAPFAPDLVLFKPFVWEPLKYLADRIYRDFRPAKGPPE